ncbi:MAG TPA: hypothetical protein VMB72_04940 [Acidimicrobiales bacterium]|nr:hypothetical protein [Acidimicrobiales bacterium]
MWRGHRRRQEDTEASSAERLVVEECSAFLAGRYADLVDGAGRPLPAWVWLNALAHGSHHELAALAAQPPHWQADSGHDATWQRAVSFLAHEIRCVARQEGIEVGQLQARVLVPLELAMMKESVRSVAPSTFVGAVMEVLHREADDRSRP